MSKVVMDVDALSHHGILGQKWGVRRTEAQLGTLKKVTNSPIGKAIGNYSAKVQEISSNYNRKKAEAVKKDIVDFNSQRESLLSAKSKSGKALFTSKEVDDIVSSLNALANKYDSRATAQAQIAKALRSETSKKL